ncbi:alpha/beta fold hydrolase [Metabacillus sp. RGM 3146]|uniref:alpha/beta fold hydrolase n=1 Tax=Metabacillus sp. RGM 3146 TaxID=3401092 RepID=UPI003B9CA2DB
MPFLTLHNKLRCCYTLQGTGDPIVFIHPTGMGTVTFHYQQELAEHFSILTYDMRGNGFSQADNERISISLLARDLKQLLDELGISSAVICGYSNGGAIAQEFVLHYPEMAKGLILVGGFSEVCTEWLQAEFLAGIYLTGFGGLPLLARGISGAHAPERNYRVQLENSILRADPYILYQMYRTTFHYHSTDRLDQISCPLLLIYGEKDTYIHSYEYLFRKYIPFAKTVYISDAKHQIPTKFPYELNSIIKQFTKTLT